MAVERWTDYLLRRSWESGAKYLTAGCSLIYPPECGVCSATIESAKSRCCRSCRETLRPSTPRWCRRCGAALGPNLPIDSCARCRDDSFAFDRVFAIDLYDSELRLACLRSKQHGGRVVSAGLADLLWELHAASLIEFAPDVVVAVPQFWAERLTRRHFAAETVAARLSSHLQCPQQSLVSKVRWTRRQSQLPPTQRRRNVRGAFRARGRFVGEGAAVLIVDDILTTGSTAHQVAKCLKTAGAERVAVAVLARGVGRETGQPADMV